jgi:hypothetical protein
VLGDYGGLRVGVCEGGGWLEEEEDEVGKKGKRKALCFV